MWTKTLHHFEFVKSCLMKFKQDNKCMGNRNVQVSLTFIKDYFYTFQAFFHTFPYLWSFSRLFKALKISKLFQDLYKPCSRILKLAKAKVYVWNGYDGGYYGDYYSF